MSLKKILLAGAVLVLVLGGALLLWARSALTGPAVRTAVADQLSQVLGQPVVIGDLGVQIFPRITLDVKDVQIGQPAAITVKSLHIGTALGALLSRKIEHADMKLSGARVQLPLPEFAFASSASSGTAPASTPPVEIVSVDEIVLDGVELVAGGRTLTGDIELVPHGTNAVTVRKVTLSAAGTDLTLTGDITDIANATGQLTLNAGAIDAVQLMAFMDDFVAAATPPVAPGAAPSPATASAAPMPMNITVKMAADKLTFGDLQLDKLGGVAEVTGERVRINDAAFNVFGGSANGVMTLALDSASSFVVDATMSGIDLAKAMEFAGSPGTMTGAGGGTLALAGQGVTANDVIGSARGTLRLDATKGTVHGLGLVKAIVLAGSMRASSQAQVRETTADEPFSRMGMTLSIANGIAHTDDLKFESPDVLLNAKGDMRLDGTAVALEGAVQLSEDLTASAGRDLVRYTQQDGKVTLPVLVSGSPEALKVRLDLADVAMRAITNKAKEEAKKSLLKGLGKIVKKGGGGGLQPD